MLHNSICKFENKWTKCSLLGQVSMKQSMFQLQLNFQQFCSMSPKHEVCKSFLWFHNVSDNYTTAVFVEQLAT